MTNYKKDSTPLPDNFNNINESRTSNFDIGAKAEELHDYGYFVPYLGTGMLALDAKRDFEKGDWQGGLINTGLAALNVTGVGAVVGGVVKGAKAATKVATKAAPKVFKSTPKSQYPNLKPSSNKPIKLKDIDPEAPGVKGLPKSPKKPGGISGGIIKPKGTKGGLLKPLAAGYLLNEALDEASANGPAGPAGVTDRQLGAAVSRSAAFQVGAGN